jgi:hypothetical protein
VRAFILILALASPAGALVHRFDGGRFHRVGTSVVDTRAPGALELLKAIGAPGETPVIGLWKLSGSQVISSQMLGTPGAREHKQLLPANADKKEYGGYTFFLKPDGTSMFAGSGHLPAPITPRVEREILRFNGVKPAAPTLGARLKGYYYRVADGLAWFFKPG